MKNITTATGTTVSGSAIEQLLFTKDWLTGVRAMTNTTISDRASCAYESAFALSGGGDLHRDAHSAAVTNLLHSAAPGIVAFALHHLRPLLPDLTDEQRARVDAAAGAPSSRVCEDLTGANGTGETTTASRRRLHDGAHSRPGGTGTAADRLGSRADPPTAEAGRLGRGPDPLRRATGARPRRPAGCTRGRTH